MSMLKHHSSVCGWAIQSAHYLHSNNNEEKNKEKEKKKKSKLVNFHKMSRTLTSAGLLCVKLPYFTPELSLCLLHTNIDSVPKHRLVKLRQALCHQS